MYGICYICRLNTMYVMYCSKYSTYNSYMCYVIFREDSLIVRKHCTGIKYVKKFAGKKFLNLHRTGRSLCKMSAEFLNHKQLDGFNLRSINSFIANYRD